MPPSPSTNAADTRPSWTVLAAYLSGDATSSDRDAVDRWRDQRPEHAAEFARLEERWTVAGALPLATSNVPWSSESAWQGFEQTHLRVPAERKTQSNSATHSATFGASRGQTSSRLATRIGIGASIAAMICLLAVIIGGPALRDWRRALRPGNSAPLAVYTTRVGQRATITLRDGTQMMLAPQTTVRVASGFCITERSVSLDGEAYFDVQTAASTPFIVRTNNVATRVVGTRFTVRHYTTDESVRVAVTSGKVSVSAESHQHPSVTLTSGMIGKLTDSTATAAATDDIAQYTGWTTGRLVFRNAPATDVFAALTRWYGYQFRLTDSTLAQQHLTVWLSTESSAAALATLRQNLDVELAIDGAVVTVSPRRANDRAPMGTPQRTPRVRPAHEPLPFEVGR